MAILDWRGVLWIFRRQFRIYAIKSVCLFVCFCVCASVFAYLRYGRRYLRYCCSCLNWRKQRRGKVEANKIISLDYLFLARRACYSPKKKCVYVLMYAARIWRLWQTNVADGSSTYSSSGTAAAAKWPPHALPYIQRSIYNAISASFAYTRLMCCTCRFHVRISV